jgi:hypothetical protein
MLAKKPDAGIYYGRNAIARMNSGIHSYRQLFVDHGA